MLRSILIASSAAVLLCAAVLCAALVAADLAARRPSAAMDEWAEGRSIGEHAVRQRMLDRLALAVALAPWSADYFFDLGRFYSWHASLYPPGGQRHRLFSARALRAFEQAIAHRPSWGYAWVRAAEQRVALQLDHRRTLQMVLRADALAPREGITQLKVIWVGLGFWPELESSERGALRASLMRLLAEPKHALEAARIARHHGRFELVRGHDSLVRRDPRYRAWVGAP